MSKARFAKVTISIPFEVLSVIDEFAEASGMARSAVITGFIQGAMPTLQTTAASLRQLRELDAAQRAGVLKEFEALQKQAENLQGEAGAVARAALAHIHETKFSKV